MIDINEETRLRAAIELLYFGYRGFTAEPDRILAERGLNRAHHRILYFIGRHEPVSVGDLLHTLAVTKQALHAPLAKLIALKLVSSTPSTADRRVRQLSLTASGRRLERRLTGTQMKLLDAVFADTGASADGWLRVMQRLAEVAAPE